jgi:hypothetical protein
MNKELARKSKRACLTQQLPSPNRSSVASSADCGAAIENFDQKGVYKVRLLKVRVCTNEHSAICEAIDRDIRAPGPIYLILLDRMIRSVMQPGTGGRHTQKNSRTRCKKVCVECVPSYA